MENGVGFCICWYKVYEEINIQNTGDTDYTEQIIFNGIQYMLTFGSKTDIVLWEHQKYEHRTGKTWICDD